LPEGRPNLSIKTAPVIGWLARMIDLKDPESFVRAAAMIKAERPEAKFIMYGDGFLRV